MKTIKVLFASLVISALSFSCSSSDDGGNPTGGDLTARWNQTKTVTKISSESYTTNYNDNQTGCSKDFLEFNDDHTTRFVVYNMSGDGVCQESPATNLSAWSRTDNTLVIGGSNANYSGTFQIIKLTGSDLQLQSSNTTGGTTTTTTIYFTKAAM